MNASFTLAICTQWNTKKWFYIQSEVCQEIAAYKEAAITLFWIMHIASDKVLFMTSVTLFIMHILVNLKTDIV